MRYPVYLSPLILLHALPAGAEVELIPAPSNIEETTPIRRSGSIEAIQPLQEMQKPPAVGVERQRPAPARSALPTGAMESIQPRGAAKQPASEAVKKAAQTSPAKDKPAAGGGSPAPSKPQQEAVAHGHPPARPAPAARPPAEGAAPSGLADDASLAAKQARGDESLKKYDQAMIAIAEASNAGRKEDALRMMKEIWDDAVRLEDFGTLGAMAYTAMALNDEATAVMAARKAAELVDDDEFYEILANVLIHFNRLGEMQDVLKKMGPKSPERKRVMANFAVNKAKVAFDQGNYSEAEQALLEQHAALDEGGLELLGWTQYRLGKLEDAAQQFSAAYAKKPANSNAQGLAFSLHRLKRYEELLEKANAKPGPLAELLSPEVKEAIKAGGKRFSVGPDGKLAVASATSNEPPPGVTVKLESMIREKAGTPGEGRLTQTTSALTASWQGESDNISLKLEGQRVDDHVDEVSGKGFYALWRHTGENGLIYRLGIGRSATGELRSELPYLAPRTIYTGAAADPAWIGEAGISYYTSDWGLSALLFRRPSDESLLAFSGKRTDAYSAGWGRVLQTGLTLSGNRRLGDWSAIASLTAASLAGENVADNKKYELYSRALRPITSIPGLSLGPELILSHYQRNLSAFEFGHGGYFSPDRYVQLGAVAKYETHLDKLELNLQAGIGHNWNWQAAAPGNPLTGEEPGKYPASSGKGIVYSALADGAWPLTPQWRIGITLGAQESASYSDWRLGLYAKGFYD
ncbi:cellulose synthase subunit BcsC-related outer membrane protein [Thiofaba sp. EF100]|uniref:cellulose synthase subunit BcsC-related outer membrane protein n=1 Tax=Thiofaba sp. EF100 TaxID=3121274 RepID=UPI003221EB9B